MQKVLESKPNWGRGIIQVHHHDEDDVDDGDDIPDVSFPTFTHYSNNFFVITFWTIAWNLVATKSIDGICKKENTNIVLSDFAKDLKLNSYKCKRLRWFFVISIEKLMGESLISHQSHIAICNLQLIGTISFPRNL